ncbi:hypothetical protein [Marinifilum fragile]|uniref:hypothetical protein n=1 Tax=Marinifilum fragile TaxID=570161 RepID=UPI002AAB7D87|nr:hypothetical protein [Marinifilum fragile]
MGKKGSGNLSNYLKRLKYYKIKIDYYWSKDKISMPYDDFLSKFFITFKQQHEIRKGKYGSIEIMNLAYSDFLSSRWFKFAIISIFSFLLLTGVSRLIVGFLTSYMNLESFYGNLTYWGTIAILISLILRNVYLFLGFQQFSILKTRMRIIERHFATGKCLNVTQIIELIKSNSFDHEIVGKMAHLVYYEYKEDRISKPKKKDTKGALTKVQVEINKQFENETTIRKGDLYLMYIILNIHRQLQTGSNELNSLIGAINYIPPHRLKKDLMKDLNKFDLYYRKRPGVLLPDKNKIIDILKKLQKVYGKALIPDEIINDRYYTWVKPLSKNAPPAARKQLEKNRQ